MARSKTYGPSLKVLYTGPFFERDPAKTVRQNIRQFMDDVTADAFMAAYEAAPVHVGYFRAALRPQTGPIKGGRKWAVTGVVSMSKLAAPWPGTRVPKTIRGTRFNYAGKVEARHHVFRKAKNRLYSSRKHNRDLLRGLN